MTTRVLIVEDEPEFLRRFSDSVMTDPRLQLVGAVSTGRAALALLAAEPPDVILVDLGLPDMSGTEVIRQATQRYPGCDCIVVTLFADDAHVMASLEAGATGYLLKDASNERIIAAIQEVLEGGAPISPSIARRVLTRFRQGAPAPAAAAAPALGGDASAGPPGAAGTAGASSAASAPGTPAAAPAAGPAAPSPLSERETQILQLVAKGFSFDTVGEVLSISPHTVVTHVKKIYRKLAVHSRGEAVYEASQMGLL
ncbi:MAG: response regulator transcription factor [Rubrivivax sp.]|nr:response regulator transcription factor [Rubrivivax sp.]